MQESPVSDSNSLVGRIIAQRYLVEAELGKGGMGVVYRARHVHMQHAVAIKVLHRELVGHSEIVKRFEREAIVGGRIRHPHVVTATDFGALEDGSHYLVLDYAAGESLKRVLTQAGVFEPQRMLRIAQQICRALIAAHAVGVVHRDLKPDNVMLVDEHGDSEWVKVLDFGIAKLAGDAADPHLTRHGSVFGTPEYMSPEQAAGNAAEERSDLYSLGVIMFEMLTGATPFTSTDILAILTRQITEVAPELGPEFAPELRTLVRRLLAKGLNERPASAVHLLAELDALAVVPRAPAASGPQRVPALEQTKALGRKLALVLADTSRSLRDYWARTSRRGQRAWLGAAALGLALGALLVLNSVRAKHAPDPEKVHVAAPTPAQQTKLDKLRVSDPKALDAAAWVALGQGYFTAQDVPKGLDAYRQALALNAVMAREPRVQADVWRLLSAPPANPPSSEVSANQKAAIALAKDSLGAVGADMLYELTRGSGYAPAAVELARKAFDEAGRGHASEALKVLLAMNEAKACNTFKALLPQAQAQADERAVDLLKRRASQRGCGFLRRRDCYPCLRADDALARAQRAAATKPKPQFGVPPGPASP
jgi:eukaryotic-like serine/threonine-protein kinase